MTNTPANGARPGRPVLVTGAGGCIGAWVTAHLVRGGSEVVCLDLSEERRRLRLILEADAADAVPWVVGDITEEGVVERLVGEHDIGAIIHLAALQVPFCKADPVAGARVNVVGQVNVFEAARHHGVRRLVYASSVAAVPPDPGRSHPATLYGVYKAADEGIAQIYWQDWSVPSIGLRPHTVYGPGRDQGVTSAPTKAMLAAAAGRPYTIPFDGALLYQYAGEVADIVCRCAAVESEGAHLFDLKGEEATMAEVVAAIRKLVPEAEIDCGGDVLPFSCAFDDAPLRAFVGDWPATGLARGVELTIDAFRALLERGLVSADNL